MEISKETIPNPGSEEALEMGCTCPILDNNYGQGLFTMGGETCFWMTEGCPVHINIKEKKDEDH